MKTKKFTHLNCAPKSNYNYTCYSRKRLNRLKKKFNKKHKDKIKKKTKKGIWNSLKKKFSKSCYDEKCWLKKLHIYDKVLPNKLFAPDSPEEWKKKPNAWLSTTDIERVIKQYQQKYKNFVNLAVSPSDFDYKYKDGSCVDNALCQFELKKYLNKKIGAVFNIDSHEKDGSHWVAVFIYPKKQLLYYFNSTGAPPTKNINRFIKKVKQQGKDLNKPFKYEYNKLPHQKRDTECGIYVLYFLITMLKSRDPKLFTSIISDNDICKYRTIYFNKAICKLCNKRECECNIN